MPTRQTSPSSATPFISSSLFMIIFFLCLTRSTKFFFPFPTALPSHHRSFVPPSVGRRHLFLEMDITSKFDFSKKGRDDEGLKSPIENERYQGTFHESTKGPKTYFVRGKFVRSVSNVVNSLASFFWSNEPNEAGQVGGWRERERELTLGSRLMSEPPPFPTLLQPQLEQISGRYDLL